ncbi:MAG: sigma-70 family RNA polymerase sigma factor [Bacilli bacterium]
MPDTIVQENERLVYSIISKFRRYYDVDDLYQVGMLGLFKAYQKFDSSFDTKFSTYAHTYIWGEVLKFVREDKSIKINKETMKIAKVVDKTREFLTQKLMRTPTITEISLFLEIDEKIVLDAELSKEFIRSLDFILNEENDGKDLNLYDHLAVTEKKYNSNVQDLYTELDKLEEKDRRLIKYRYFEDYTQSEASQELGMSQVQVSRTEAKILTKLKNKLIV